MSDIWDDDFSAYDIDNLGKKDDKPAVTEDLNAQEPEPKAVEPVPVVNSIPEEAPTATETVSAEKPTPEMPEVPATDDAGKVDVQPAADDKKPWWMEDASALQESPDPKPLTKEDLELMAKQQEAAATIAAELLQQARQIIDNAEGKRLPRGLRAIATHLSDTRSVLTATKALVETYIKIDVQPLFQTIKKNRLKTTATVTANTLNSHADTMREGFADLTAMMAETDDRPSLNLRTRIIKGQTTAINNFAVEQAKAFYDTANAFPLQGEALLLLCLLGEEHDEDTQTAIDDTLRLTDAPLPLTADAPEMRKAIQRKDERAISSLVKKTAEARANWQFTA